MSYGYSVEALAYAIRKERDQWTHSTPGWLEVTDALDRLARDVAIGLHPDKRKAFLARCGTTED